jgi:hypothetical protein
MEALITGAIYTAIIQMAKKFNVNSRYFVLGVALIGGMAYSVFQMYFPETLKENVTMFFLNSWATSVLLYEFLIKPLTK